MQFNSATESLAGNTPILAPLLYIFALGLPFIVGWVLGCTHNLPVQPILFLTNLGLVRALLGEFVPFKLLLVPHVGSGTTSIPSLVASPYGVVCCCVSLRAPPPPPLPPFCVFRPLLPGACVQGIKINFLMPRKSEMAESYNLLAGSPGKVPGTGVFAPVIDGIARTLGFMPRNASHFVLDPSPTQVGVWLSTRVADTSDSCVRQ